MPKNIWVISDTHFNHANILNFVHGEDNKPVRPGFADVQEMNEIMIQRWNECVQQGDTIYHLGDVVFGEGKQEWLNANMPRLNGKKRLVFGNHDEPKHFVGMGHFSKTSMWRMFSEHNILMTHVPVHPSTLGEARFRDRPMLNVHGHIHQNQSPEGPYRCVCVEHTDYRPVHIEDLAMEANKL